MELISECALRVAKVGWQPRQGSFAFTVVCKATFELRPEVSPLAAAQEPVVTADVYTGDGASLALASELVPLKKRPEVLVIGHAYAPEGRPVTSLVARLAVGEIDKAIHLVGDRCFGPAGLPGEPAPFTRMPLVWQRAAGGPGTLNPAGRPLGAAARTDPSGRVLAPNALPVGHGLASQRDVVPPVGFGPIAPTWPSRAAYLHRHAAFWDPGRWHERPLPEDIDLAYFNAAPPDQQRAQPFGEEQIYLENLHPRFARLSTRLAPVTPAVTGDLGPGLQPLPLRCDTLVIDTDRGLAMLVWRAHVLLDREDRPGRVVVTGPGAPEAAPSARDHEAIEMAGTLDLGAVLGAIAPPKAVLPFPGAARAPSSAPPRSTGAAPAFRAPPIEQPPQPSAGASRSFDAEEPLAMTEAAVPVATSAVLPFVSPEGQGVAPAVPWAPPEPPRASAPQPTAEPLEASASQSTAEPLEASASQSTAAAEPPRPAASRAGEVPPPPLVGAIAALFAERAEAPPGPVEAPARELPSAAEGDAADAPGPVAEPAPEVAVDAYPPERCGALAARLACDGAMAGDILRAEELDEARWQRVHAHWLDRIRSEAARSRKGLLSRYDGAYVGALEAKRGPLSLDDYAHLAEAAERGAVAAALAERGLPEGAWPHIHRVWIERMVKDVRLGKQVRSAIDALRAAG